MDEPSTLVTVATIIFQVLMVVGPVTGYVDQYLVVSRTKSSRGFSIETCGVLLIANIIRIFFWLGKRFDPTLFYQSILMVIVQLVLLELVIRHRPGSVSLPIHRVVLPDTGLDSDSDSHDNDSSPSASLSSLSMDPPRSSFWHWPRYIDYAGFLIVFTGVLIGLYLLLGGSPLFIELLGFASLGVESTLPIPQCVSNFRRKSVEGFSTVLLVLWTVGDGLKFAYFLWTKSPLQFLLCGAFQVTVDFIIFGQFIAWSADFRRRLGLSVDHLESQYEPIREENI
ncbi:hypothetical protein BC937DRAFT_86595 [Endogone sp. FLAS-F59071]|nr:hypothetical protein BC937DRAFT_86595 [Endogone sp. FLAS-F59071]|eukprot:RUS12964.1 hypothetical protein BC937DRAFT_86595 [Endogone sp. FLAS-F59071]